MVHDMEVAWVKERLMFPSVRGRRFEATPIEVSFQHRTRAELTGLVAMDGDGERWGGAYIKTTHLPPKLWFSGRQSTHFALRVVACDVATSV